MEQKKNLEKNQEWTLTGMIVYLCVWMCVWERECTWLCVHEISVLKWCTMCLWYSTAKEVERERRRERGEGKLRQKGGKEKVSGVSRAFSCSSYAMGGCFWHLHSMGFLHLQSIRKTQKKSLSHFVVDRLPGSMVFTL